MIEEKKQHGVFIGIVSLYVIIAILIRWPTIPYIYTLPLESNTPLHALAALGLREGHVLTLPYLEWPIGAQVRYIAWPVLIITTICNFFVDPIPAINIGVFLWFIIQGIGGYIIGEKLHMSRFGSVVCGVICMCSPHILEASGNGQFENISLMSILWLYWALEEHSISKHVWMHIGISFALTLFSSPYQGVVALMVVLIHLLFTREWHVLFPIIPSLILGAWYFGAVSEGSVHASVTPAHATVSETARLYGFLIPQNIAENGGEPMLGPMGRIVSLTQIPTQMVYSNRWPWIMSTATDYIGIALFLGGLYGLWKQNNKKLWALLLAMVIISMGKNITIATIQIPLPWSISDWVPGIKHMQATIRFLSGVVLICIIGLCHIISSRTWSFVSKSVILLLLILDCFLIAPHNWPIQSKEPILSPILQEVKTKQVPIAYWPSAPIIASHKVTTTALVLQIPLATFHHPLLQMPNETGDIDNQFFREDATSWLHNLKEHDIHTLVQFRDMVGSQSQPFFSHYETCDEYYCSWNLTPTKKQNTTKTQQELQTYQEP